MIGRVERYTAATYDIRTGAVGVSGCWRWLSASFTTNRLQLHDATTLGASLELGFRW